MVKDYINEKIITKSGMNWLNLMINFLCIIFYMSFFMFVIYYFLPPIAFWVLGE